jgi:DNA polymerase-1
LRYYVTDLKYISQFQKDIFTANQVSLDTETTGLDCHSNTLILVQIKINNNSYILNAEKLGNKLLTYYISFIEDKLVIGHNIKFDIKFIKSATGIYLKNVYDTMIAEILSYSGIGKQFYSLKELVEKYCGITLDKEVREYFYKEHKVGDDIPEDILEYSDNDIKYLEIIKEKQYKRFEETKMLNVLDLENRTIPVTASMEFNGIKLDVDAWKKLDEIAISETESSTNELKDKIVKDIINYKKFDNALDLFNFLCIPVQKKSDKELLKSIKETSFMELYLRDHINLNSNKQVLSILNNIYGLNLKDTNEKTLNKITNNKLINDIINYRGISKKVTSFGEKFIENVNPVTGKIHSNFNQLGTRSGRYSSSDPNLQNIVRESEYRTCFIADDDYVIITFDYSQQELRFLCVNFKESNMIKAFVNDIDLHTNTASLVLGVDIDRVTKDDRHIGKTLNFGIVYGISEWGLFKNFSIPLENGKKYIKNFYEKAYPSLSLYKDAVSKFVLNNLYSSTPIGRKRFFSLPTLYKDYKEKQMLEGSICRKGFNHVIQGGCADMTKLALCNIFYNNPFGDDKLKILMQVHDEIVCMARKDIANEAFEFIKNSMLEPERFFLKDIVPAKVEGKIDNCWSKG